MEKTKISRREWTKNVLIIFLIIMLLLTFFSNTIMNHSLPEVSVDYMRGGEISTAIRGSGVVETVDPYNVTISEGRKIESVSVKKGDKVSKGDVLFVLADGDSTEVTEAQKAYNALLTEYQTYILDNKITSDVVKAAEARDQSVMDTKLATLEQKLPVLEQKQQTLDDIDAKLSVLGVTVVNVDDIQAQIDAANVQIEAANSKLEEAQKKYDESEAKIQELQAQWSSLSEEEQEAQRSDIINGIVTNDSVKQAAAKDVSSATADIKALNEKIKSLQKNLEDKQGAPTEESAQLTYQRAIADNDLKSYQEDYDKLYAEVKNQMELQSKLDDIEASRVALEKLKSKTVGNEVTAPVSGTVIALNYVAGETAEKDAALATIQLSDKELTMDITVTKQQAARVKPGDKCSITSSWYYQNVDITVTSIKNDVSNPSSGNRIVVCSVTGDDAYAGMNLTVSIGDKTASYDMVVPKNSVREDKNGSYILSLQSKSTPLGNRYTAKRVDVTVLASDDTNSAITCALEGYESIITTSNKPIQPGDQVRLAD